MSEHHSRGVLYVDRRPHGAALQLLKKQCPKMCGLQNPILGSVLQFAVASRPFGQILHDGDLHWVTVATLPAQMAAHVILYDSLNDRVNTHCKKQIASLLSRTAISVRCVVDTSQRQSEVTDCGLFATAAATSVCFRDFTSGSFDQAAMRGHFRVCHPSRIIKSVLYFKCIIVLHCSYCSLQPSCCSATSGEEATVC